MIDGRFGNVLAIAEHSIAMLRTRNIGSSKMLVLVVATILGTGNVLDIMTF